MDRAGKLLCAVAGLPFTASLIAGFLPAAPAPIAAPGLRPALAFEQYSVDLGNVRPSPHVGANFYFRNKSDRNVKITGVKPSCGCIAHKLMEDRTDYGQGGFGLLQVSMATANEDPGPHDYTITVSYNDGQPRTQDLHFAVILPRPTVHLEPSELFFYQSNGEPASRTVFVHDYRDEPFKVESASLVMDGKPLPAEIATITIESEQPFEGHLRTPLRIDVAGETPPRQIVVHAVVHLSDPAHPTLKFPILIDGTPLKGVIPASAEKPANDR
jgi:hypothetical protein